MSIVDGYKKVKRYIQTNDGHELMSQWTSSDTVETDGKTLTEVLTTKADLDTNGKVKLEQMPKVALDNLVKVENDTARFALTTDDVQTGDTVKVLESDDGSGERMYLVVDDTKLDSEDGYTGYSASTTWETIEGRPGNLVYLDDNDTEQIEYTDNYMYTDSDSKDNVVTFESQDEAILSATSWTNVGVINSGDTHSSLFNKLSATSKNTKYLYNDTIYDGEYINNYNYESGTASINTPMANVGGNVSGLLGNMPKKLFGYVFNVLGQIIGGVNDLKISKQPTITGAATTITDSDLTDSRVLVSDANGKVAVSSTTSKELGYVHGVTKAIQSQLNGKQNKLYYMVTSDTYTQTNSVYGSWIAGTYRIMTDLAALPNACAFANEHSGKYMIIGISAYKTTDASFMFPITILPSNNAIRGLCSLNEPMTIEIAWYCWN